MADNDYIGNIQSQRLNQQWSNSMAWSTPAWMQARMPRAQQRSGGSNFRAPSAGVTQSWDGGQMHPSLLKNGNVGQTMATGFGQLSKQFGENRDAAAAAASAPPAPAPAPVLPTAPLPALSPTATPYTPKVKPTLPTAPLAPPSPTATPFTPTTPSPLPSSPLPPPAPGVTPFGAPPTTPAFPAPGTPAPARLPMTPLQQNAVAGVSQNKAQPTSTALAGQPSNPLPPMQRPPSVMATNRPPRTPANKPARTRAQKRGIADAAFASIRQSLNNQKP